MASDYVIALTTLPADADAAEFGRTLVDERLARLVVADEPVEPLVRRLVRDQVADVRPIHAGRDRAAVGRPAGGAAVDVGSRVRPEERTGTLGGLSQL